MQVKTVGNEVSELPPSWLPSICAEPWSAGMPLCASALSQVSLSAKGDYLWVIKKNRSQMYQDIHTLFELSRVIPGGQHRRWISPGHL